MAIVLASQSPRRRQLMKLVTPNFEVDTAEVDEAAADAPTPCGLALALALQKAAAVAGRRPGDVVIGCDTVVELAGQPLGKPGTPGQAVDMLAALAGKTHLVHTGVCVLLPGNTAPAASFAETTKVEFSDIPMPEILAYVKTGEPFDKAGGYGIQGQAARYIPRISGCYYNVMGLPVAALYQSLAGLGVL